MDLFEGMIQKDQDEFRKIMNRLMSTGFILRRKEQTKSDYYFILRHRSVFERYLDVLSYQIDINEEYGVIQLLNRENYNHLQLTMHESIILLILRILFDEKKRELSLTDVVVNMGDIQEKYLSMQIRSEQIGKTVMGNALKKFRRYSLVELLDGNNIREESRVLIYDSIMMAVRVDDIKRVSELLERYRKDGKITEGEDDNTSDYISEGLMKSLIHASRIAVNDPQDYEARSNIMWTATWALNTLVGKGKTEDWMVHMLGQAVGAYTDATHGMTLAAVSLPYYRYIMPYGLKKFARFATEVWGIIREGKTDEQLADEGLKAMENWMKEIGLVMNLKDLGATEDMIEGIADATFILNGGYKVLDHDEVIQVLKASMG